MEYDNYGRVSHAKNIIDYLALATSYDASISTDYNYKSNGALESESTALPTGSSVTTVYDYDEFLRVAGVSRTAGNFRQQIEYIYYSQDGYTSNLVNGYTSTVNGNQSGFTYAYDSKGNITKIVDQNNDVTTYTYDDLGQLISEVKGDVTRTYTYDNAGNIKSIITTTEIESLDPDPGFTPIIKAVGTLPKVTITTKTLTYGNSQWGDLLTAYNGTAITYDGIGNPLSYYNGTSYTFTWEGRRLVGAVKGAMTMSFAYNDEGIRTSKTVNGVTTTYYVNGGRIVAESNNSRTIVYIYDVTGSPIGMMYRTTSYAEGAFDVFWYEKNLQGDIVAVYNSSGTKLVTYDYYDAWGNYTVSYSNGGGSTGAQYNPFRYRGYYYDTDLGMYYLQSRYYDAKICRFISADYARITTATPYALTDKNLYAYCDNNPVVRVDDGGMFWDTVFDVVSLAFSVAEVAANPYNVWAWVGLAGDIVDLIPFVSGVGETVDAIRICTKLDNAIDAADNVIDAAKFLLKNSDKASDLRRATGSYEILYASGKNYVGKGGFKRAIDSAISHAKPNKCNNMLGDVVVSINWRKATNNDLAFVDEFLGQCRRGVNNPSTYNKIWSPGRSIFYGK